MQGLVRNLSWVLLILLGTARGLLGQMPQQAIDSLTAHLHKPSLSDSVRAFSWIRLAEAQAQAGRPSLEWGASVRKALAIARKSPSRDLQVAVHQGLGELYYNRSESAKGAALYRQALRLAGTDLRLKAYTLTVWAENLRQAEVYSEAESLLVQALAHENVLSDNQRAVLYRNYGSTLGDLGRTQEAIDWTRRSLALYQSLGLKAEEAYVLGSLAAHVSAQGDNVQALKLFQQAARLAEAEGLFLTLADVYNNLSLIYSTLNEPKPSRKYLEMALELNRRLNRKAMQLINLLNLANTLHDEGELAQSVERSREAILLADSLKRPHLTGVGWLILGLAYKTMKDYTASLEALSQARQHINPEQTQNYISYLNAYAGTLLLLGRAAESRQAAAQALQLAQKANMQYETARAALAHYEADSALGLWASAFRYSQLHNRLLREMASNEQSREIGRVESKLEMQQQLTLLEKEKALQQAQLEARLARRRSEAWALGGGLLLVAVVALLLWNRNRLRQRANRKLAALNNEIQTINSQLNATLVEVQLQRDQIGQQHQRIRDSIEYASRIQAGMLPEPAALDAHFARSALVFWPRDTVSGDFYWLYSTGRHLLWAVADCTGHGVPGAFMSLIAKSQLDRLAENMAHDPAALLEALDEGVRQSLQQYNRSDRLDGLDLGLCVWEPETQCVHFAGANRPLWVRRGSEIMEYAPTPRALGGQPNRRVQPFEYASHQAMPGDQYLLFSDGIVDQFGPTDARGKRPLKWGPQRLREFWLRHQELPLGDLPTPFEAEFRAWMGDQRQLDDCTWWCIELPAR